MSSDALDSYQAGKTAQEYMKGLGDLEGGGILEELRGAAQAAPNLAYLLGRASYLVAAALEVQGSAGAGSVRCVVNGVSAVLPTFSSYADVKCVAEVENERSSDPAHSFEGATITFQYPEEIGGGGGELPQDGKMRVHPGTVIVCVVTSRG